MSNDHCYAQRPSSNGRVTPAHKSLISGLAQREVFDVPFEVLSTPAALQGGPVGVSCVSLSNPPEVMFGSFEALRQDAIADAASGGFPFLASLESVLTHAIAHGRIEPISCF